MTREYGVAGPETVDYGYVPRTRDVVQANRRTVSRPHGSAVGVFKERMARILDVSTRAVPEIFVNSPEKAVRTNGLVLRSGTERPSAILEDALEQDGIGAEPLDWYEGAYLFNAEDTDAVQELPVTQKGGAFIQNPSSYLPVLALDAEPGMKVMDMCSAPGGKTALIADRTADGVDIVANELKDRRRERLKDVLGTLGVRNVRYGAHDGRHLPNIFGRGTFDRVLVDAECSTEAGVNFKSRKPLEGWSTERITRMSVLQKQLIAAGYDLLRPGGVMVYSTCTVSPEENEEVVASLLERRKDAIVQPLSFTWEPTVPNLKKWNGRKYPSEVSSSVLRIRPGDYMEGFFVARIRRPVTGIPTDTYREVVSLDNKGLEGLQSGTD